MANETMELIRLAAAAAPEVVDGPLGSVWNPANDDDDSKNLRAALGISYRLDTPVCSGYGLDVTAFHISGVHDRQRSSWHGNDQRTALRMATLNVAATLGSRTIRCAAEAGRYMRDNNIKERS